MLEDLAELLATPSPDEGECPEPEQPERCGKCGQRRAQLTNRGTHHFPEWWCGSCLHRDARRVNTREMWGRGRRGY